MRHHDYEIELPFSARRLWALFQSYDLWKEYAPAVLDVEIVYPGDDEGNGLVRKVIYPLPFGRQGRVVRAGEERPARTRLRLRHAARRAERVGCAGAGAGRIGRGSASANRFT